MPLQIREEAHPLLLGLEPPGNIARELGLYRRGLFARYGARSCDASAFAFPEISALAFLDARPKAVKAATLARALEECWIGIEGGFASAGLFVERGFLYLGLEGPWDRLRSNVDDARSSLGLEKAGEEPYAIAKGFFLCRAPGAELSELPPPPELSFRDCSLAALRLSYRPGSGVQGDAFAAATWRERARSRRRTGASEEPSQRISRP